MTRIPRRQWISPRHAATVMTIVLACLVPILAIAVTYSLKVNLDQVRRLNGLVRTIQMERVRNTRAACEAQNDRHDRTVIQLDRQLLLALKVKPRVVAPRLELGALEAQLAIIGHRVDGPARQLLQTHDFTVLLIDALAPERDCDAVVIAATGQSQAKRR